MMPHVDDGTLHALIDGALRAESPERAVEAEAHLEGCADCRARLETAAGLRDEARRILDDVAVDAVPAVPDFADVRARAGLMTGGGDAGGDDRAAGDRRAGAGVAGQLRWTRGLAWAATLVVALGTGYLIRDLGGPTVMGRDDAAEPARTLSGTAAGEAADRVEDAEPSDAAASRPPETERETERADARERTTPAATPVDEVVEEGAAPTGVAARNADEAPTQAAKVAAGDEREPGPPLEPTEGTVAAAPPAAGAPPVAAEAAAVDVGSLADRADRLAVQSVDIPGRQEGRWIAVEPAEAAAALGGSLYVLPRASLIEVYRARDAATPEALTLQRLSSGVTVRVTQRAAGAEGDAAAVAAEAEEVAAQADAASRSMANLPAASTVTVQKDGFVLEITGSLPAELLVILGESATPAG
jgi:hypothetical protein